MELVFAPNTEQREESAPSCERDIGREVYCCCDCCPRCCSCNSFASGSCKSEPCCKGETSEDILEVGGEKCQCSCLKCSSACVEYVCVCEARPGDTALNLELDVMHMVEGSGLAPCAGAEQESLGEDAGDEEGGEDTSVGELESEESQSGSYGLEGHAVTPCPTQSIVGRLRSSLEAWRRMGASNWVLKVLEQGYKLPFLSLPPIAQFKNHSSCSQHESFVSSAVEDLLACGAAIPANGTDVHVVSPLGVVEGKKLRLILDLRYVNKHLAKYRFRCDGLDCFAEMYQQGDWLVQFDLKSAYHHIEIWEPHVKYLGFQWKGVLYLFRALPFGLSTAPYCFYKVTRVLVKWWRGQGLRCFLFYDDGSLAHQKEQVCAYQGLGVREDILRCGFLLSEPKCHWDPRQYVECLGYEADMLKGMFHVPERRWDKMMSVLSHVWENRHSVKARTVAAFVGHVMSMRLAIGPVTRLWTRSLYRRIMRARHYGEFLHLDADACRELGFWRDRFSGDACGTSFPIWPRSAKAEVVTYSDASNWAWGGHLSVDCRQVVAHGNWAAGEQGHERSSTWRELRAVRLVLQSTMESLRGKNVVHKTDNQNVERIIRNGSRVAALQEEAVGIYDLCMRHFVRLSVQWIPREMNTRADYLSKFVCRDDYRLDASVFDMLDKRWGPHSLDVFASHLSAQLPRFFSQFWCPGSEGVDAFSHSWAGENNWLFPPPYLISRVLAHMEEGGEDGTLVVPFWPSQRWWPRLSPSGDRPASFVLDWCDLQVHPGLFHACGQVDNCFTNGSLTSRVIALRLCFCGKCHSKFIGIPFARSRYLSDLNNAGDRQVGTTRQGEAASFVEITDVSGCATSESLVETEGAQCGPPAN